MSGPSPTNDVSKDNAPDRNSGAGDDASDAAGGVQPPQAGSNRPVVLVVDDSKTVRRSASGFLTDIGLSVVTASDGFEALAKVVDARPAMVFVDIMMPRLDGYQTCALIKNNAEFRDIPVVMLSSKDGLFDRARGRVAGADDHLAKPFNAAQMAEAVAKHLRKVAKASNHRPADITASS